MSNRKSSASVGWATRVPQRWKLAILAMLLASAGCGSGEMVANRNAHLAKESVSKVTSAARHPVHIRTPSEVPSVDLGLGGKSGKTGQVSCQTCHSTRSPNLDNGNSADLDQFHQGLKMNHGNRACVACHNPGDGYQTLHLADGRAIEFADVMTLCAQCHGPQFRDYQHGSHGGMTGHWDLTRGPRQRNNCIDCHDPHAPQFPAVMPAAAPRDRFWTPPQAHKDAP